MEFLVASIVGAIIGYITNWLAIKMLFRPYKEIRLFNKIKLPFTPGLIPKEKDRIAKAVGEAVGAHLLSNDVMVDALRNEKVNEQINAWTTNKVLYLKNNNNTIKSIIEKRLNIKYDVLHSRIKNKVCKILKQNINIAIESESFKNEIGKIIKNKLDIPTQKILESNLIKNIYALIRQKFDLVKQNGSIKYKIQKEIVHKVIALKDLDKQLKELLPEGVSNAISAYIYNSKGEICEALRAMLKQEDISLKIKNAIASIMSSNLNPLILAFVKVETVHEKLLGILDEYLKEANNQKNVAALINELLEKLLSNKLSDVLDSMSIEDKALIMDSISDFINNNILTDDMLSEAFDTINSSVKKYDNINLLLYSLDNNYFESITDYIYKNIKYFIQSEEADILLEKITSSSIDKIVNIPIESIIESREGKIALVLNSLWKDLFEKFLQNDASKLIEAMNISKVVEDRINSFDVAFAEELIISIANKELRAITSLGALLGAIIGLVTPLI